MCQMARFAVLAVLAAVIGAAAAPATSAGPRTVTATCASSTFTIAFDPKRHAVVTDGAGHVLASASFTTRGVSTRCRRVAEPKRIVNGGLGPEIRRAINFRCLTSKPIRVHVNPIRNDSGAVVGSFIGVGLGSGTKFRTIVSAVLKNKGDPYASRVYRASAYCKL